MGSESNQRRSVQGTTSWKFIVSFGLFLLLSTSLLAVQESLGQISQQPGGNIQLGKLDLFDDTAPEIDPTVSSQTPFKLRTSRLSSVPIKRDPVVHDHKQDRISLTESSNQHKTRQHVEITSMDCTSKRNELLKRQHQTTTTRPATTSIPQGFQRLKPRNEFSISTGSPSIVVNDSLVNNFDGEHIPRCRYDGTFEPIQCHRIGYCWCVNKHGQAIKNSAVMSGEEPFCDPAMYDSDSDDLLVVAGISAQRMKGFLKPSGSPVDSTTPNGNINFEATDSVTDAIDGDGHQQVGAGERSGTLEPTMPLIPNNCEASRMNAKERASKHVNDSIWVPECDSENEKFYAERQCHRSRVCWCVDQSTGLPLRTGEQLTRSTSSSNCTEIKRILELTGSYINRPSPVSKSFQPAFFQGSSEFCDAEKRIEFVLTLNNQFRQQIVEYLRQNSGTSTLSGLSSHNPFSVSETQISKWKFTIMDNDMDGKLGDREWSKFKNNFKLVDKADELDNPFKLQKSPYFSLPPLLIVRSQRKCWRDFLEFCASGDLLVDESISLMKWLSCTEAPPKSLHDENQNKRQGSSSLENTHAHSREAAIVRSKKRNPFLGILKPD